MTLNYHILLANEVLTFEIPKCLSVSFSSLIIAVSTSNGAPVQSLLEPLTPLAQLPCVEFVDLVTLQRYDEALLIADSLQNAIPSGPESYFFRLTVLNNRTIDFEDNLDQLALEASADSVIAICKRRIAAGDTSALVRFYLGSTGGFKMIHALRDHEFISAIRMGAEAAATLEEAVKIDSTSFDSYCGLGNYYYFQSRYGGILRSAGIIKDRRDLGIDMLREAAEHGYLTAFAAASSIAWIWIDKEQPDSTESIMRDLLKQYPQSRAFLWCYAKSLKMQGRWEETIVSYRKIVESVRNTSRNNYFNEIGALHSIAIAYGELAKWNEVVKTADEAFALPISVDISKRKAKDLEHLKELKSEALEHLKH